MTGPTASHMLMPDVGTAREAFERNAMLAIGDGRMTETETGFVVAVAGDAHAHLQDVGDGTPVRPRAMTRIGGDALVEFESFDDALVALIRWGKAAGADAPAHRGTELGCVLRGMRADLAGITEMARRCRPATPI